MNQREERVEGSIEMLARNSGQNDPANARSDHVIRLGERASAIHGDFVAARRQARRKLFGERLKTAVASGNTSRPDNSNFHLDRPALKPVPDDTLSQKYAGSYESVSQQQLSCRSEQVALPMRYSEIIDL